MVVRIRFSKGPLVRRTGTKNQRLALGFAALLVPSTLTAWVLALWRVASDLRLSGSFAIQDGLFSHWQAWTVIALFLQSSAVMLNRYGRRDAGALSPAAALTQTASGAR